MTTIKQVFDVYAALIKFVDDWYKPKSDLAQTNLINVSLVIFNSKLFDTVVYDDELQIFSKELSSIEIQILANAMAYNTYMNIAQEFASTYGSSSSSISIRSYKHQFDSKMNIADNTMKEIDRLVFSISEYEDGEV